MGLRLPSPCRLVSLEHVSLVRIPSLIRRRRRRGLALLAALAVAATFSLHHLGPAVGAGAMGAGHHDLDLGSVAELCLGVLTVVGAALATATLVARAPGPRHPPLVLAATGIAEPPAPSPRPPRARSGIAFLCVMRC